MSIITLGLQSTLNISEQSLGSKKVDHQWEMAYGLSNGHVTNDVTMTPECAVRQYGRLSERQLGFLLIDSHSLSICCKFSITLSYVRSTGTKQLTERSAFCMWTSFTRLSSRGQKNSHAESRLERGGQFDCLCWQIRVHNAISWVKKVDCGAGVSRQQAFHAGALCLAPQAYIDAVEAIGYALRIARCCDTFAKKSSTVSGKTQSITVQILLQQLLRYFH